MMCPGVDRIEHDSVVFEDPHGSGHRDHPSEAAAVIYSEAAPGLAATPQNKTRRTDNIPSLIGSNTRHSRVPAALRKLQGTTRRGTAERRDMDKERTHMGTGNSRKDTPTRGQTRERRPNRRASSSRRASHHRLRRASCHHHFLRGRG